MKNSTDIETWDVTSCPFCGYTGAENKPIDVTSHVYFCVFCHSLYKPGHWAQVTLIHDQLQESPESEQKES